MEHTDKIVFVRLGDFYEAIGIDAFLLNTIVGIPRVKSDGVPRIRCARKNLAYYLRSIVQEHGFEAVICEESGVSKRIGHQRAYRKHYVAAVVGGAGNSHYLGSVDPEEMGELDLDQVYPLAAVSWSQSGFSLFQYFVKENAVRVTSRMTEEALWAKLHSTGMAVPLYLHAPSFPASKIDSTFRTWETKAKEIASSVFGSVDRYDAENPLQGFMRLIVTKNPTIQMEEISMKREEIRGRASPPPLSTVREIGIRPRPHSGVLPLMDYLLPGKSQKLIVSWMEECIVDPPPPEIAIHIQQLCRRLGKITCSVPQLNARLSPNQLVEVLNAGILNADLLDGVRQLLRAIVDFMSDSETESIRESVLRVAERQTRLSMTQEEFLEQCKINIDSISTVIKEDPTAYAKSDKFNDGPNSRRYRVKPTSLQKGDALRRFFESMQPPWWNIVNSELLYDETAAVIVAQKAVEEEVMQSLLGESIGDLSVICDADLGVIMFQSKMVGESLPTATRPDSRKRDQFIPHSLDRALAGYRSALERWNDALDTHMKQLSALLRDRLPCVVTASHATVILSALTGHITEAQARGWTLPDITNLGSKESKKALKIRDFWPYWMKKEESTTNSIELDGMAILTGPNTAGKSTVLRSIAAVCCLGMSGFYVPASFASIPFLDCVNLKTLVTDSPLENLSAFGMEMTEMKHVLNDATEHTLVLIDELGKGTEVMAGTALSASIFKELHDRNAIGIFATHLHRILDFQEDFPDTKFYRMEVRLDASGDKAFTWKMIPGFCESSLGLQVALQQGIPQPIVDRAQQLIDTIERVA